jgi:hypothetical protein
MSMRSCGGGDWSARGAIVTASMRFIEVFFFRRIGGKAVNLSPPPPAGGVGKSSSIGGGGGAYETAAAMCEAGEGPLLLL